MWTEHDGFRFYTGNNLDGIKDLPDNSVDAIVTDPPYGLGKEPDAVHMLADWVESGHHNPRSKKGFMNKEWDAFVPQPLFWAECLRVLKPGGHLLSFASTRTQDLMALGIRLAGFEIRDSIAWVYGSGFPKSRRFALDIDKRMGAESEVVGQTYATAKGIKGAEDRSEAGAGAYAKAGVIDLKEPTSPEAREWAGWGTALKPAMEPIVMAQKPFPGTVADNVLTWRTGGFNIDDSRVPYNGEVPNLGGRGNHGRGDGYGFNPQGEAATANTKGRHPANFIHDGSQGVLDLFPDSNGSGSAARFFYCPKPSSTERDMGLDGFTPDEAGGEKGNGLSRVCVKCGTPQLKASACPSPDACPRSWEVPRFTPQEWDSDGAAIPSRANRPNAPRLNTHETLKPVALMRYLVRLVTPPGGTVLDPFTGSGTTGIASLAEGFSFIGMEQEAKYARIAKTRILCGNTLRVSG